MLKKIINWTGGGIFRTLGRIIAYVIIGGIAAFFLSKSDFNINDLIGFETLYAAELKNWSVSQTRLTLDDHGTSTFTSFQNTPYTFTNLSLPVKRIQFRLRSSDGLSTENTYNFSFGFLPNPDSISWDYINILKNGDSSLEENNYSISRVYRNGNGYYMADLSISPRYNYNNSSDYMWITIFLTGGGGYQTSVRPYMYGYDERLGTNAVITDQTNKINNSIKDIDNTLKDTDVNSDTNDMSTFLHGITTNKDGVISSILTLPLTFFQTIFSDENTDDLCFTLKGKQACLPNGKIIWSRNSSSCPNYLLGCATSTTINAFKTFFNLVVAGFICYKLLIGVAKTYDNALDPMNNGIEVMKL